MPARYIGNGEVSAIASIKYLGVQLGQLHNWKKNALTNKRKLLLALEWSFIQMLHRGRCTRTFACNKMQQKEI